MKFVKKILVFLKIIISTILIYLNYFMWNEINYNLFDLRVYRNMTSKIPYGYIQLTILLVLVVINVILITFQLVLKKSPAFLLIISFIISLILPIGVRNLYFGPLIFLIILFFLILFVVTIINSKLNK